MKPLNIAIACFVAMSASSIAFGGEPSLGWDDTPEYKRESSIALVEKILANPEATPESFHTDWVAKMIADGWKFDQLYDETLKTHPQLVLYADLSQEQRTNDHITFAMVNHLRDLPDPTTFLELSAEVIGMRKREAKYIEKLEQRQQQEIKEIQEKVGIAVQYIGMKAMFVDRLYGTGLTFTPTQRRVVPVSVAEKLLKHPEFRKVVTNNVGLGELQVVDADVKQETQKQQKEQTQKTEEENKIFDEIETINRMNTKAVLKYVRENYDQKLDESLGLKGIREEAINLIHRFGLVG